MSQLVTAPRCLPKYKQHADEKRSPFVLSLHLLDSAQWEIIQWDPSFQGYNWSSRKPRHGYPCYDRSSSMFDSWEKIIMIIRLYRNPSNGHLSCYRENCERRFVRPCYFLPLINRSGFVSVTSL
ncbi:hypothetical protein TNCV_1097851 [Trichonephila clavipes]|nr:hypothetical protein TNCV_1097851 [Trichonephila clavipes]